MPHRPILAFTALGCLVAAIVWGRAARRLRRAWHRIDDGTGSDAAVLARSNFRKVLHTATLYGVLAIALVCMASLPAHVADIPLLILIFPVAASLSYSPRFLAEARLAEQRAQLERRAEEVLEQEDLAPRRWADRLAPEDLPTVEGFEVGRVYEAGTGLMAGDFYDLYTTSTSRLAAVIGDVSGHGIDSSITAFQVKYLLRVFLLEYRDPGQALEKLNEQFTERVRPEEFVSLAVAVFDQAAGVVRYASAGHPAAWMWHDGEVRPLRATGPLLTLDPRAEYISRELPLDTGDVLLMYTDGLAEARSGGQLFGEERIAGFLRRDPGMNPEVLCKGLLDEAKDFSDAPLTDDVAILAIQRT
jgi:sigma-B regulation protein RsbU (phosphoserine phosphatase)